MNNLLKRIIVSIVVILILAAGGLYAKHKIAESNSIGKEYAAKFAADEAGYKIEEVVVKTVDFKNSNGRYVYHVELEKDDKTYEYDLLASNGSIISRGQDAKVDVATIDDSKETTTKKQANVETNEVKKESNTDKKDTSSTKKEVNVEKKESDKKNNISADMKDKQSTVKKNKQSSVKKTENKVTAKAGKEKEPTKSSPKNGSKSTKSVVTKPKDSTSNTTNTTKKTTEKNSNSSTNKSKSPYIGSDTAKNIALKHAGVSTAKAVFSKAKLEEDDGVMYYQVEFSSGSYEYEYDIAAKTGKIIDYEWDNDD